MYKVRLPNFEGPLDLLLFFIKRDELDIYDIPIADIANEFLEYVRLMEMLDLELAGEFLVMAASLMQIKVRMLLPKEEVEGEEEDEENDPRAELVRRLLEYKRYKEASEQLGQYSAEQRYVYYRQVFSGDSTENDSDDEYLNNVTLFDLLTAFKDALRQTPKKAVVHNVDRPELSIEDQAEYILSVFSVRAQITFVELVEKMERVALVVTFLALLELVRSKHIAIRQEEVFGEILIFRP